MRDLAPDDFAVGDWSRVGCGNQRSPSERMQRQCYKVGPKLSINSALLLVFEAARVGRRISFVQRPLALERRPV
jgi:hypothetical protein